MEAAEGVAEAGAKLLRGGAFKPRTSPYDFQGMEEEGLKLLQKAKKATGLAIVTEVMSDRDVDLVARIRRCHAGGRAQHAEFRAAEGPGQMRPARAAEARDELHHQRVADVARSTSWPTAIPNVILCERGIRTFETATRNTCDISAIPVLNELTHLPVILDPSHATGKRSLVPALARAGVAIGADGLIIEVHPAPGKSHQRWRAIPGTGPVRPHDGRPEALHRALESGPHQRSSRSRAIDRQAPNRRPFASHYASDCRLWQAQLVWVSLNQRVR